MNPIPDDPEITLSLMVYLLTEKLKQSPPRKLYLYYVHQFIKLHFSLLFGTSSTRFGGIATHFGMFMKKNASWIFTESDAVLTSLISSYRSTDLEIDPDLLAIKEDLSTWPSILLLEADSFRIVWFPSSSLSSWANEKGHLRRCVVSNLNVPFSRSLVDPVDWRVPAPPADFPHYSILDELVEHGLGVWIPKVGQMLEDVGFVTFVASV